MTEPEERVYKNPDLQPPPQEEVKRLMSLFEVKHPVVLKRWKEFERAARDEARYDEKGMREITWGMRDFVRGNHKCASEDKVTTVWFAMRTYLVKNLI